MSDKFMVLCKDKKNSLFHTKKAVSLYVDANDNV